MKRFVYLAGPIMGCTSFEANDWRQWCDAALVDHGIVGVSPLRCEPLIGERYSNQHSDKRFGDPRAIAAKNKFDVINCDITLAYLPKPEYPKIMPSLGTIGEIFWADAYDKRVILVSNDPVVLSHPVIDAAVDWKLDTLQEAMDVCIGVLSGYTGGKNV